MNKKKTNIKIKKSKINIYNKRKNKTRQTMTLVMTIALACILVVVGYGIGKPIMKYFSEKDNSSDNSDSISQSVPAQSSSQSSSSSEIDEPSSDVSQPLEKNLSGMCLLPSDAVSSEKTLRSALAQAKESGYTKVVVTLKDDTGVLLYKSEIDRIKNKAEINVGTLTSQQIYDIIAEYGMTAAARISTLKDRYAPYHFGNYALADSGVLWLDNSAEAGGKPWLNPFESSTADYISELAAELSAAGFKDIICADTIFPPFTGYDKDTWLKHMDLRNAQKRSDALWQVLDKAKTAAAANGATVWAEIEGDSLLSDERTSTSAEIAYDTEKFSQLPLVIVYNGSDISADVAAFAEKISSRAGSDVVVLINDTMEAAALEGVKDVFSKAGFEVLAKA